MTVPPYVATSGGEAADLMVLAGVELDPWQRLELDAGLGEKPDGSWSAFEVAQILSRQNGKNVVFEARELAGLFLLKEQLILHTAHEFKTAAEAFRRIESVVTDYDWFRRKIKRIDRTRGEEGIELLTGQRLRFIARSKGSGRGFSGNCVILDEAYALGDDEMAALLPTLSAMPNPQLWYGSSAGIQASVQLGRIWRRIRKAAASGVPDASLAGFEWAAELCTLLCRPGCREHDRADDPRVWAKTNPGLTLRIPVQHVAHEHATMSPETFARERLGVGDYPADVAETWAVIGEAAWRRLADPQSRSGDPVAFAARVSLDRSRAWIGTAGFRPDGRTHIEIVGCETELARVVPRLAELKRRWRPCAVVIDPAGQGVSLIEAANQAGLDVALPFTSRDAASACGQLYDLVMQEGLAYRPDADLDKAVAAARIRPLSDAWAWDSRGAAADVEPLRTVSDAVWGLHKFGKPRFAPYNVLDSVK